MTGQSGTGMDRRQGGTGVNKPGSNSGKPPEEDLDLEDGDEYDEDEYESYYDSKPQSGNKTNSKQPSVPTNKDNKKGGKK